MTATATATPIIVAAREAYAAGLCVVPPLEDGSKAPDGSWKDYQRARPTKATLREWFTDQRQGLGIVTGKVSGNVEMFEFDDRATFDRFIVAADAAGLGDLVARIRAGYESATPGDGFHWFIRCEEIAGNTTLARRPQPDGKKKALIQTRGEGGYSVEAPSHGRVHPSGKAYRLVSGSFATIATITPEERRDLWALARSFDEVLRPEVSDPTPRPSSPSQGDRPGDLFNAVATWEQILEPHGWERLFSRGGTTYWRRPGKDHGISATTNWGGYDYFYVFTTSTEFDDERGYTRFSAYAHLEYGGDFKAAARALRAQGYGGNGPRFTTATLDGERVDVATPGAEVDDTAQALAELRARIIELERSFRHREEEWSALGQHLSNENISPTDRIIMYKLASEALSRPPESGDEDGYRLIRIGMTHRKAQREGKEAYGLAAAAGVDDSTVSKALKKYASPAEDNPDGWGLIARRERHGRDEEGRPRSDILVRLPADRPADVMVEWRGFSPENPRNHGGRRMIEVPEAVAAQSDPVQRERKKTTRWRSALSNAVIATEEEIAPIDFWTAQGEELQPEEVAQLRRDLNDEPRADAPSVPPTVVEVAPQRHIPYAAADDEPDDADPLPLEDACWHHVGTPWACTTSVRPARRNPNGPQYCDYHHPDAVTKRQGPTFAADEPPQDDPTIPHWDCPAPPLPDEPTVAFTVPQTQPQGLSRPARAVDGVNACARCGTGLYSAASHCVVCRRIIDGVPLQPWQRDPLEAVGGDVAAGGDK